MKFSVALTKKVLVIGFGRPETLLKWVPDRPCASWSRRQDLDHFHHLEDNIPALTDPDGTEHDEKAWNCKRAIGKLNFLEKSTRPDQLHAAHQCSQFAIAPKQSFLCTRGKGMIVKPNKDKHFECWVDADFAGNWDRSIAQGNPDEG